MKRQKNFKNISDEQIESYYNLVYSIAKQYKNRKIEHDDLIQEGLIGLCDAINNYDESKGKFSTFAWYFIDGMMKNVTYRNCEITAPQNTMKDAICFSYKLKQFQMQYNEELSLEQISELSGISLEDIKLYITLLTPVYSLEQFDIDELSAKIYDRDCAEYDLNNYFEDTVIENAFYKNKLIINIFNDLELTPFQKQIIYYRYGFDGGNGKTLQEIADEYNVTKECIRTNEKKALKKIKRYLTDLGYSSGRNKNKKNNRIIR